MTNSNHCCVHVDLTLNTSPEDWLTHCERAVPPMLGLPGLKWKLWVLDPETNRAGGVYLFQDIESARAYAHGPIITGLRGSPVVAELSVRVLPLLDSLSRRTRGHWALDGSGAQEVPHELAS